MSAFLPASVDRLGRFGPAAWCAQVLCAQVLCALVLCACPGPEPGPKGGGETGPQDTSDPDTSEPQGETEEWTDRWNGSFVAYLADTGEGALLACEDVGTSTDSAWQGAPLFTLDLTGGEFVPRDITSTSGAAEREALAATALARFCWISPASTDARELGAVAYNALLEWADESGAELSADLPNTLPLSLPDAADAAAKLVDADVPYLAGFNTTSVRVAIADTEPAGTFDPLASGTTTHGRATAQIVYSLLCDENKSTPTTPTNDCGASIEYVHALPFELDESVLQSTPEASGGAYGSYTSLAVAVRAATIAHGATALPMVLNLSLGWNGGNAFPVDLSAIADLADPNVDDPSARIARRLLLSRVPSGYTVPPSRAFADLTAGEKGVYMALVEARCHGILPLAASGNRTYLPTPVTELQEGALLPGGWVDVRSTDPATECLGYRDTLWAADEPLVWAVSGVDRQGRAAGIGRPGSTGPLNALAMGVAVPDSTLGTASQFHSVNGTSAAAAVATAAAAAVWSVDPALDADDVVRHLYEAGQPVLETDGTVLGTVDIGDGLLSTLAPASGTVTPRAIQLCTAVQRVDSALSCTADGTALGATGAAASSSPNPALSPAFVDCTDATASGSAPCGDRFEPTFDVQDKVWPQPVGCTCPPCELEIHSDGSLGFDGTLGFGSASELPFWQAADFTAKNDIRSFTLVLRESPFVTSRIRFNPGSDGFTALTGTPVDTQITLAAATLTVNSATLVIQGTHRLTGASWSRQVPFPVSYATLP